MEKIRTRYAPSPTGYLHVGQIPTALFNYLFARKNKGEFIIRIEDTDPERSKQEFERAIFDDLKWLGIEPDESPIHGGAYGPYRQTERTELYKKGLEKLLAEKRAFWCDHKIEEGSNVVFWCSEHRETGGTPKQGIIRFKNPFLQPGKSLSFFDTIRGEITFDPANLGDFSIARNLESSLYNFVVVIDDNEMKITDVIRGEDHIPNTPKQILLYEALGIPIPRYAHLPIVLAVDRTKLSKRKGAMPIREYAEQGYLPEALINAMALIGWNPGDDREIFSKDELIKEFSLDRVQKSGAIFDGTKLEWINGEYIRKLSLEELYERAKPFLPEAHEKQPKEFILKILALEQPRLKKLSELREGIGYFFETPQYDKELLRWKKMTNEEFIQSIDKSISLLQEIRPEATSAQYEHIFLENIGAGDKGTLLWPLRVALSGKKASPGPFDLLAVLGPKEALSRLERAKALIQA